MRQISACASRALSMIALIGLAGTAVTAASGDTAYEIDYTASFRPEDKSADVTMKVRPDTGHAKRFTFTMDPALYTGIEGDGDITIEGDQVEWMVPKGGGHFRYRYGPINHRRGGEVYDAQITADWTILRGDDLFPAGKALLSKGADSRTRLHFELPEGWTKVDTGFDRIDNSDSFVVTNPKTRFDRPVGWIIAGSVGNRFERIAGVELSIAAPKGSAMHRNDILVFCSWILPELQRAFDDMPNKILIVGPTTRCGAVRCPGRIRSICTATAR